MNALLYWRALPLLLLLVALAACSSSADEPTASDPYADVALAGTEKMVHVLADLNAQAFERPQDFFLLNDRRADLLLEQLKETENPGQRQQLRLMLVQELINAGRTEEAIDQIRRTAREAGVSIASLTSRNARLIDLLALAYLRLGEEENCLANPTSASCIIPVQEEGVHQLRRGSEMAADLYFQLHRRFSTNLVARWLYNIAHMTLGTYPEGVEDRFLIRGLEPEGNTSLGRFRDVAMGLGVAHDAISGGAAVDDFTGNGYPDILVTSYGLDDQMRFYASDGDGGFEDRTTEAGLDGLVGGLNVVSADYNNDGHMDVFVLRGAWLADQGHYPNSLLRNNGDGTFTDVTYAAGLASYHPTQTATWGDFTGNGYVDLFVGNESGIAVDPLSGVPTDSIDARPSELYANNGDGTFTNVAEQVGVEVEAFVKGATWCDVNNSGRPDLFVSVMGGPNKLFVNEGGASLEDWRFEEQALEAGVVEPTYGFTTWCWDMDNDGHEDLFVTGYDARMFEHTAQDVAAEYMGGPVQGQKPRFYRNNGDGTFADVARRVNLDKIMYTMGANIGDLTGNGYLDFYVGTGAPDLKSLIPNRLFLNRDGAFFSEATFDTGVGHIQKGHGVAFADFTRSGHLDIYSVMGGAVEGDQAHNVLFAHPGHDNNWIGLSLEGTTANRAALGARLALDVTDAEGQQRTIHRTISTGGSFGASPVEQTIGVGQAAQVDRLTITWPHPDSAPFVADDLPVNQYFRIVEGSEAATPVPAEPTPFRLMDASPHTHHSQ